MYVLLNVLDYIYLLHFIHVYNEKSYLRSKANAYGDFLIGVKRDKWNWLDKSLIKFNLRYDAQCYQYIYIINVYNIIYYPDVFNSNKILESSPFTPH